MKPLPAQSNLLMKSSDNSMPSLPTTLASPPTSYSNANRRASASCSLHRAYPWLLFASTGIAATFCLMYISKPVIYASQGEERSFSTSQEARATSHEIVKPTIMPDQNRLPGDVGLVHSSGNHVREVLSQSQSATAFEQTNIRIQHILTAEAPGGHLARIDLDVPVLYQSRNLRWTPSEVAEARALLAGLSDYQEKSGILRAEGVALLDSWNRLIARSIPSSQLRADSPTLPTNQQDAADTPRPAGLDTSESIQMRVSGK